MAEPLRIGILGAARIAELSIVKPAANAVEARRVADAARAAGVTVLEAFHYPFHPLWQRVVEVVASGAVGEVQHVETLLRMPAPPDSDPRWRLELAAGSTMDLGCYALHAQRQLGLRFLGGEPRVVCGAATERAPVGLVWTSRCRSSWSSRRVRPVARDRTWTRRACGIST